MAHKVALIFNRTSAEKTIPPEFEMSGLFFKYMSMNSFKSSKVKMAELNNIPNVLKTLNIAENILCSQMAPLLPDEHSCQTTLLRVK